MILEKISFPKDKHLVIENYDSLKLPSQIQSVYSVGKRIIFLMSNEIRIVFSLRMTGSFLFTPASHTRAILILSDAAATAAAAAAVKQVYFNDIRQFAQATVFSTKDAFLSWRQINLGWDPLGACEIDFATWKSFFKNRNKKIAALLQDQKPVCGIGNYLRAEILFRARIAPNRLANSLTDKELKHLLFYTCKIMQKSLSKGGHTLDTYCDPRGIHGKFKPRIYGLEITRDYLEFPVEKIKIGSQTVYWCPSVQQ
jgi:formamidopyrimidine-DNA glycosylase